MAHRRVIRFVAPLVVAAFALAACSSGDDGETSSATTVASGSTATGGEPEPVSGFDGTTITLGVLVPLSGLPAIIGNPLAAGQEAYWDYVNAELGGIAGRYPVEIIIEDTLYETNTTVQKYNRIKDEVVLFAQVMGTPHNLALLPLLEEDNIVVAPASQDAFWVREQHMLPIIEPYQIDVINAMDYWLNEGGGAGQTVCAVIENDVYGEAGLEGLEFASGEFGFDIATVARFRLGDGDFTAQVTQLQNEGCEMVWATALPTEFSGILGTAARLGFTPQWIAQSPAWVDELGATDLAPYLEEHVWIAATGPEPEDRTVPGVTEMLEIRDQYRPEQETDYYFNFGFFQAMAVQQLLEHAVELGDLGRDGIITAMNDLDALQFNGLMGDYTYGAPEDRDPSRQSSLFSINMSMPFGLEGLRTNFTTDAAGAFEFVEQEL